MSRAPAHPYLDRQLSPQRRAEDLLARLTLAEKVGLMFHPVAFVVPPEAEPPTKGESLASLVRDRHITHFNVAGWGDSLQAMIEWHNAVQRLSADAGHGVPVTFSSDPRHGSSDNDGTTMHARFVSQWPDAGGIAAIGSESAAEEYGRTVGAEYRALGIHVALHPQVDVATEPRWARVGGTFGEDAQLAARLGAAYIRGLRKGGDGRVAAMVKHFPGGSALVEGEDPHFHYGQNQAYPGGQFWLHLLPFVEALAADATQVMVGYGRPRGTMFEEVGFGFNRGVVETLLRDALGFDGVVCTDWGILSDMVVRGQKVPAKAWGLPAMSVAERMLVALDAGVDQFGGETCTDELLSLVHAGRVTEARVDASALRVLREKFRVGLYDEVLLDCDTSMATLRDPRWERQGYDAQQRSVVLLSNTFDGGAPTLPLTGGTRVYVEGMTDLAALEPDVIVVDSLDDADVAFVRVRAPHQARTGGFEEQFHSGSLEFRSDVLARLGAIAARVPLVVDIHLERPAVVGELARIAHAMLASFGSTDRAIADVLCGRSVPTGRLPFALPASMTAVEKSRTDVPLDFPARYGLGHGLTYSSTSTVAAVRRAAATVNAQLTEGSSRTSAQLESPVPPDSVVGPTGHPT